MCARELLTYPNLMGYSLFTGARIFPSCGGVLSGGVYSQNEPAREVDMDLLPSLQA